MTKTTNMNVRRVIAKEFGVKADQVILLESTGDIETFNSFNFAEEHFALAIKTSTFINLGFYVPVLAHKNPYTNKITYTVDSGMIKRNETFDDYIK